MGCEFVDYTFVFVFFILLFLLLYIPICHLDSRPTIRQCTALFGGQKTVSNGKLIVLFVTQAKAQVFVKKVLIEWMTAEFKLGASVSGSLHRACWLMGTLEWNRATVINNLLFNLCFPDYDKLDIFAVK